MVVEERRKGWRGTAGAEKPNARRSVSTRATVREGGICRREGRRRVEGRLTLCPFPPTIRLVAALLLHRSAVRRHLRHSRNGQPSNFSSSFSSSSFVLSAFPLHHFRSFDRLIVPIPYFPQTFLIIDDTRFIYYPTSGSSRH